MEQVLHEKSCWFCHTLRPWELDEAGEIASHFSYLLNMSYERNIILERMQYILLLITLEKYDIYCTVECLDIYSKIQTKTSLNCIKFHLHIFKNHFTLMQCSSLLSKLFPLVRNGFVQLRYFVNCKTTYQKLLLIHWSQN